MLRPYVMVVAKIRVVKHRAIARKYRTLNEILISESIYKYSIGYIPFTHVIFKKKKHTYTFTRPI